MNPEDLTNSPDAKFDAMRGRRSSFGAYVKKTVQQPTGKGVLNIFNRRRARKEQTENENINSTLTKYFKDPKTPIKRKA
jgi:hypothetical protein